jgi:hypothetical protein
MGGDENENERMEMEMEELEGQRWVEMKRD